MGNTLLDFVMALVRDPQAAARYAADPAAALSDAHLPGVTVADVANLMPVVTDSLAMSTPDFGSAAGAANVWTSGAASAAFDAFAVPHPAPIALPPEPQVKVVPVEPPSDIPGLPHSDSVPLHPEPLAGHSPVEPVAQDWADDSGWQPPHDGPAADHHPVDHPGFDLF